jgi:hypothetical protein
MEREDLKELDLSEDADFIKKFFAGEFKSGKPEIDEKINLILKELKANDKYITLTDKELKEFNDKNEAEGKPTITVDDVNKKLRNDLLKVAAAFKQLSEMKYSPKELSEASLLLRDYQYLALRRADVSSTLNKLLGKESRATLDKFNYLDAYLEAKKRESLIDDLKTYNQYLENSSTSAVVATLLKRVAGFAGIMESKRNF